MADAQVKCINKDDRNSPYERITHVGGSPGKATPQWKWTLERAIQEIESGRWRLYAEADGDLVWLVVASRNGRKYLKTENDGDEPNNLLSLPECP